MKKKFFAFTIALVSFLMGYFLVDELSQNFKLENNLENIKYVELAGQKIKVDLALTKKMQEQGLSGRSELKENEGMLFIFPQSGSHSFWMKDMNFPIDMIWIGEDLKVVYIKKYAKPESYPEIYVSKTDAKYILETASGFSDKNNLREGDRIEFF